MRPTAFNSFDITPRLPKEWDRMALKNIHSFGNVFDLEVSRAASGKLNVIVTKLGHSKQFSVKEGERVTIRL